MNNENNEFYQEYNQDLNVIDFVDDKNFNQEGMDR